MFAPLSWIAVTALACIFCNRASSSSGVSSVCSLASPCRATSEARAARRSYDGSIPCSIAASRICSSRRARAARAASRRSVSVCGCASTPGGVAAAVAADRLFLAERRNARGADSAAGAATSANFSGAKR